MKNYLINSFIKNNIVKFGDFTLKSGKKSNIYIDMRSIISYPILLKLLIKYISEMEKLEIIKEKNIDTIKIKKMEYTCVIGVPYGAISLATAFSLQTNVKSLFIRKEKKKYGTKKQVEGHYNENEEILLIEDVITSGQSILETIKIIEDNNLKIKKIITIIDREEGGIEMLRNKGYNVCPIFTKTEILDFYNSK
tara:strand:+ start:262 stop:843 length:582 start_codon:yes stop_codon:yes gene_type:complete